MKCEMNKGGDKRETQPIYRQKQKQYEIGKTDGHSMYPRPIPLNNLLIL